MAVKIESGRVPEWPMGTDCKSAAFQLRWFESTRAHQEIQYPNRVLDLLLCGNFFRAERADSNSCGAVAEDSAKTARWAVFSSAARDIHPRPPRGPASEPGAGSSFFVETFSGLSGRIRTASARPVQSGGQKSPSGAFLDARLATFTIAHQKSSIRTGYWIFCFVETFSGPGGKKANVKTKVRSLPRPAGCVKLEEKIAHMRCILGGNRL